MSGSGDEQSGSEYLVVNTDRRGAKRKSLGNNATLDKRPAPRKQPQHEIKGTVLADAEGQCSIVDVSLSGLKIRSDLKFKPGQELGLHFLVPNPGDAKQVSIVSSYKVVWNAMVDGKKYLIGLQLIKSTMTESQLLVFQNFVDSLPDSPNARHRT